MLTNPIYYLNGSGLSLGDIYTLTLTSNGNGSVYSTSNLGVNGYTTTLSAVPSAGYQLSAFSADYGTINGNEYTFTTNDAVVSAFFEENTYRAHTYTLMQQGGEYGWQLPIDVLLDAANNGLSINVSFYTTVSDSTNWESYFYIAKPQDVRNWKRLVEDSNCKPVVVSAGYRECNITSAQIVNGLTQTNIDWLNNLSSNGYTYVFSHNASFQTNKFIGEPSAEFWFLD